MDGERRLVESNSIVQIGNCSASPVASPALSVGYPFRNPCCFPTYETGHRSPPASVPVSSRLCFPFLQKCFGMIGQSRPAYFFIRVGVFCFRAIAPLSISYCLLRVILLPTRSCPLLPLTIVAASEAAFYTFVFLPRKYYLQRPAVHPPVLCRDERRAFFS